jgi:DNA-binding protein H-NS
MTPLKSYSLPELEELALRIQAEIIKREQEEAEKIRQALAEAEAAAERARQEAIAAAAAEAARLAAEKEAAAQKAAAALPVRYMHPSNRALTWSGLGPRPEWISAWLATGGTLYALEVAAEKLAPRPIPESLRPR